MTNQIKDPEEAKAFDAMNAERHEDAANLFYRLYQRSRDNSDCDLTHSCVAIWIGSQNACGFAANLCICAKTNFDNRAYATELFIASLFKLRRSNSNNASILTDSVCETVERTEAILDNLVNRAKSTYAMPWLAQILRGMARYDDCSALINRALADSALPQDVAQQLRGCRDHIAQHDRDSTAVIEGVKLVFPSTKTINGDAVRSLNAIATKIWREVCRQDARPPLREQGGINSVSPKPNAAPMNSPDRDDQVEVPKSLSSPVEATALECKRWWKFWK